MKKILAKKRIFSQNGMSALLVVIIIGVASIVMAKGVAFLSIGELDLSQVVKQDSKAFYHSEACLEEALYRLRLDSGFSVTDKELLIDDGSCIMSISGSQDKRIITTIGISGNYRKTIESSATIDQGRVVLDSFEVLGL